MTFLGFAKIIFPSCPESGQNLLLSVIMVAGLCNNRFEITAWTSQSHIISSKLWVEADNKTTYHVRVAFHMIGEGFLSLEVMSIMLTAPNSTDPQVAVQFPVDVLLGIPEYNSLKRTFRNAALAFRLTARTNLAQNSLSEIRGFRNSEPQKEDRE